MLIHGDGRPENIGNDPYGIRPLIDWANARMGFADEDLASLETGDNSRYLDWYAFAAKRLGNFVENDTKERLICLDVLQPYRGCSFKLSQGWTSGADRYLHLLEKNTEHYLAAFK